MPVTRTYASTHSDDSTYLPIRDRYVSGPTSVRVGGLRVHRLTSRGWADQLVRDAKHNQERVYLPRLMTSANGHVLSRYASDSTFRTLIDQFDGIDADGMPLVMASRWLTTTPLPEQVCTDAWMHTACEVAQRAGLRFYFLGTTAASNERARERLAEMYPHLEISGGHHGYIQPADYTAIAAEISQSNTDLLWIGTGVPFEQQLAVTLRPLLRGVTWIKTTGAGIDYAAGKPGVPSAWSKRGFGWAYRFWKEPRLRARYLRTNPHAAWLLLRHTRALSEHEQGV